jgi:hypothetical protein
MVVAPPTPLFQRLTPEPPETSTDEGIALGDGQKAKGGSGLDVGGGRRVGLDEIDDMSGSEAREMLKVCRTPSFTLMSLSSIPSRLKAQGSSRADAFFPLASSPPPFLLAT